LVEATVGGHQRYGRDEAGTNRTHLLLERSDFLLQLFQHGVIGFCPFLNLPAKYL
jgi:hypothetical protein